MQNFRFLFVLASVMFTMPTFAQSSEEIELSRCYQETELIVDAISVTFQTGGFYLGSYLYRYNAKIRKMLLRYDRYGNVVFQQEVDRLQSFVDTYQSSNAEFCRGSTYGDGASQCRPELARILFPKIRADIASRSHFACSVQ